MATNSGGAGNGGKSPTSSRPAFNDARDGKASERKPTIRPATHAQQQSANKVADLLQQPKVDRAALKSASSGLAFNVRSQGVPTIKTTVEPKKQPQPSYKAKDGTTYKAPTAMNAANNLDRTNDQKKGAEKRQGTQATIKKHHAPAPTPPGVIRDGQRGRSVEAMKTKIQEKSQTKAKIEEKKLAAHQSQILKQSIKQSKSAKQSRGKDKGKQLTPYQARIKAEKQKQSKSAKQSQEQDKSRGR